MKGTTLQTRERVRMLLSLVAYAVGYKMMVGATILFMSDACGRFLPHSPCMANDGAHNTVDAWGMWGVLSCLPGMGIDGAHNTIGQNVGTHNTAWVLTCLKGCRAPF